MALLHSASKTPYTISAPIHEDQFVTTVKEVQNISAQVPGEAHIHDQERGRACYGNYQLPRGVEYQLAQDLAFIAAHEEGVHTVSAATVEETASNDLPANTVTIPTAMSRALHRRRRLLPTRLRFNRAKPFTRRLKASRVIERPFVT